MESFVLEGAPDQGIGSPGSKSKAVQVMHLDMSNDLLEELLDCIKMGKSPQILFGKNPLLKYDGKSVELQTKPEKFHHELYLENQENDEHAWQFSGLINHSVTVQDVEKAAAGTDRALETLKNTMASIEQEQNARKTVILTPEVRPIKGMSKAQSKAAHLKPLTGRSSPTSPAFGSSTPSHLRPPTSAGLEMPNEYAIKKALTHFLAIGPSTYLKCRRIAHTNPKKILEKIAKLTNRDTEEWTLQERAYKDLDVWNFEYSDADREVVVKSAVKAYDRLRLPREDPLRQMLLQPDKRGQGIVLSNLHVRDLTEPGKGTPSQKPHGFDKKTGLPKRKDPKKAEKESAKAKKGKDESQEEKPKAMKSAVEARTPKVEPRKERVPTKRTMANPANARTPDRTPARPSAAAKGLLNKPRNPSPLGASPSVNASDFKHSHPVHKKLSAATSPRSSLKRKADETNGNSHRSNGVSKRPHTDSSSSGSSSDDRPLHLSASTIVNGMNGHHSSQHSSIGAVSPDSDSSEGGRPLALSWRQSVEMARKFNLYYQRYKKLYTELSQSTEPPSEKKREELLEMHRRLEDMKRKVNNSAL